MRAEPLFWAFDTGAENTPVGFRYAVRAGDWKLIADERLEKTLLYNLRTDPHEVREVSSQQPEKVQELLQALLAKVQRVYADPLRPR